MENLKGNIAISTMSTFSRKKPEHVIRDLVKEIESGALTIQQAMAKYNIKKIDTIRNWIIRFAVDPNLRLVKQPISTAVKRQAAIELVSGNLTMQEASRKYNASPGTINDWRKKYSCEVFTDSSQEKMKTILKATLDDTQEQIIQKLKLKISALETMIDLAEEEFNISIRKKFGAKQ